jgi:hypothetical protein
MSDSGNSTERPWLTGPPPPPPPPSGGAGAEVGTTRPMPSSPPRTGAGTPRAGVSAGRTGSAGPGGPRARPGPDPAGRGPGPEEGGRSGLAAGTKTAKSAVRDLMGQSPWMLGAGAILVVYAASWFASILLAFQHSRSLTGQARVLSFFAPGTITLTLPVLLGVALVAAGHRFDLAASAPGWLNDRVPAGLFIAGCVSGASAAIDVLVELANFGHGIDRAIVGVIEYASIAVLAVVTALWARMEWRNSSHHQGGRG